MALQTPYTNEQMLRLLRLAHRHSNPNMLDNWYFADPINQRGQTEYADTNNYFIDRWIRTASAGSVVSLVDGGIKIDNSEGKSTLYIRQIIEGSIPAGTYTLSLLVKEHVTTTSGARPYISDGSGNSLASVTVSDPGLYETTYTATSDGKIKRWQMAVPVGCSITLYATKFELGPTQTLAYQDDTGAWVLNDPPPNKQEMLARCQRFAYVSNYNNGNYSAGFGFTTSTTTARAFFPVPVSMREEPSISDTSGANWRIRANGNAVTPTAVSVFAFGPGVIALDFEGTFTGANIPVTIAPNSGTKVVFSADL